MATNIFREAKHLLDTKPSQERTEEEVKLISTAIIPLMIKFDGIFPEDITIGEGLDILANFLDGAKE